MPLALSLLLILNIAVGCFGGVRLRGGVQTMVPPAMRALSAAVLLFVINMISLGGGPTAFGMTTDAMTNHYLAGTGLDVQACKVAAGAAKVACAAASAHGIKMTVYLSTAISPFAMLCFFLSQATIKGISPRPRSCRPSRSPPDGCRPTCSWPARCRARRSPLRRRGSSWFRRRCSGCRAWWRMRAIGIAIATMVVSAGREGPPRA